LNTPLFDTKVFRRKVLNYRNRITHLTGKSKRAFHFSCLDCISLSGIVLFSNGNGKENQGIEQVKQVIMQNNATAEESAAASEEMSSQSGILKELTSRFKLRS